MEPVKPLLKSDKTIQTPAQEAQLKALIKEAQMQFDAQRGDLSSFYASISFTPTQEWLDRFAELGLRFIPDNSVPHAAFTVVHRSNERFADVPQKEVPWVPQNSEEVEASFPGLPRGDADYIRSKFIGADGEEWVVRALHTNDYARVPQYWVRKPKKTQVPLAELLSVYASVKGLTQDGVELKPEN